MRSVLRTASIRKGSNEPAEGRRGRGPGLGLFASLGHPGGNLTGATTLTLEVGAKRLELLHEMLPTARVIAALINPTSPNLADIQARDLQAAARVLGLRLHVLEASTDDEFGRAFARANELGVQGLVITQTLSSSAEATDLRYWPPITNSRRFTDFGSPRWQVV